MDLETENKHLGDQLSPFNDSPFAMTNYDFPDQMDATLPQNYGPSDELTKSVSFPRNLDILELTSHLKVETANEIFQSRYSDIISLDRATFRRRFFYLRTRAKQLMRRRAQRVAFEGDWFFKENELTPFGQLKFSQDAQGTTLNNSRAVEKESRDLNKSLRAEMIKMQKARSQDRETIYELRRKLERREAKIEKVRSRNKEANKELYLGLARTETASRRNVRDAITIKNLRSQLQQAKTQAQHVKRLNVQ